MKQQDSRRTINLLRLRAVSLYRQLWIPMYSKLHQFLYGNTNYTPTQDVLNKSAQIAAIVGGGQVQDTAPAVTDAPNTTTDNSYTWEGSTDTSADYSYDDSSDYSDNSRLHGLRQ